MSEFVNKRKSCEVRAGTIGDIRSLLAKATTKSLL